jgi:hypothetical protein
MKHTTLSNRGMSKPKRLTYARWQQAKMRCKIFILKQKVIDRERFINACMKGNITEYPQGLYPKETR